MAKRSLHKIYLDTTPSTSATYTLLGTGVDSAEIDYGPKIDTFQDITQDTATSNVTGYEPKITMTQKFEADDPAFIFIDDLRRDRALLSDAETNIIMVDLYKAAVAGAYPAEKQPVSVAINKFGGGGGEDMVIDFDLNFKGDATKGTFNPSTKVFTAS